MDQNKKFINIDDVPFLRVLSLFYELFSIFIVIASFGIACILLPQYWKRYRAAKTKSERTFYGIRFSATWCLVYALFMFALLTVDECYQFGVIDHWPTISFLFLDWNMPHSDSVCIDLFIALVLSIPLAISAEIFGSENEQDGAYRLPERVAANDHIQDVMSRYHAVKASNPKTSLEGFSTYPEHIQKRMNAEYKTQLADIEDRVRTVHQIWKKPCPID